MQCLSRTTKAARWASVAERRLWPRFSSWNPESNTAGRMFASHASRSASRPGSGVPSSSFASASCLAVLSQSAVKISVVPLGLRPSGSAQINSSTTSARRWAKVRSSSASRARRLRSFAAREASIRLPATKSNRPKNSYMPSAASFRRAQRWLRWPSKSPCPSSQDCSCW